MGIFVFMKFLFSFLFCFSLLLSSLQVKASVVEGKEMQRSFSITNTHSEKSGISDSQPFADLLMLFQQRNSNIQCRYFLVGGFIDDAQLLEGHLQQRRCQLIDTSYSHNIPIGLLLIFPKHYFF